MYWQIEFVTKFVVSITLETYPLLLSVEHWKSLNGFRDHIKIEIIAPDDPTNAPVIIKAVFSKVNPIPAAAQPEYEFNIDITTGISAPPIGIINKKPIKKDIVINIQNKLLDWVEHKK